MMHGPMNVKLTNMLEELTAFPTVKMEYIESFKMLVPIY
jgi:hypothetical protein